MRQKKIRNLVPDNRDCCNCSHHSVIETKEYCNVMKLELVVDWVCDHWFNDSLEPDIKNVCPYCDYIEYEDILNFKHSYNKKFQRIMLDKGFMDEGEEKFNVVACPICGSLHNRTIYERFGE